MTEREIFIAAVQKESGEERAAYLQEVCAADSALRERVRNLLRVYENAGGFLESPAPPTTVTRNGEPPAEVPGTVIGPYKLLEPIGEGGMGVVYMAEQQRPVRRKVALKIIKPGMDTKQVIARFEAERQALALMDHPNIARVIDAGATESGRPYFVMELVRGIPITDHCDRNRLVIADRLELFVRVCQAVQHAHQKGIIHRDLKPSNVLVTMIDGAAVPKIIDFGVAKAMGHQLTERTLFTGFAQLIGTPLYMSPEQAEFSGVDVDTRSDIYSLGVLLYELLTGTTPFNAETFRTAAYDEIRRIIREEEPPRPSTRISTLEATATEVSANRQSDPRELVKSVRGELDWIVMKALDKDRARRYETPGGLATDVRRYLADEPVQACPPSAWYRFSKLARRNRTALAVTAGFALMLSSATAVSTWQAWRATRAESLARQRLGEVEDARAATAAALRQSEEARKQAEAVSRFLVEAFRSPDPSQDGSEVKVADVLDRAVAKFDKEFAGSPATKEELLATLAGTYDALGLFDKSFNLIKKAAAECEAKLGPNHPETLAGQFKLAVAYRNTGRFPEAIALFKKTLKLREEKLGPDHPDTQLSRNGLAWAYEGAGMLPESIALHKETLKLREEKLGVDHYDTQLSRNGLANAYMTAGKTTEAIALYESALKLVEEKQGPLHGTSIGLRSNLASAYRAAGKLREALALLEPSLKLCEEKLGRDHSGTLLTRKTLVLIYWDLGQHDRAVELGRRDVEAQLRVFGLAHPNTVCSIQNYSFAAQSTSRANSEACRKLLETLRDRARRELGHDAEATINLTGCLAGQLAALGQADRVPAVLDELPDNRHALDVRHEVARILYTQSFRDASLALFQRVEASRPRLVPAADPVGLWIRTRLALLLRENGRFAEARSLLEQTAAEALRLRKGSTTWNRDIEQPRGIAQQLLRHWPGLAPGISPAERPPASLAIDAPFRAAGPVADGRIEPGEYGPGFEVTFDGDANPGRLRTGSKLRSKTPDDLSARFHAAYTDHSLFLAFRVRDQFIRASERHAGKPDMNDSVEIYVDGDQVANDHSGVYWGGPGNREGFVLIADVAGHPSTVPQEPFIKQADWKGARLAPPTVTSSSSRSPCP
jgi:serine/threonine protein kinase/tetratricopeptide (TPR) repeat protein